MHTQGFHNAYTTSVEIQNNTELELGMILHARYYEINHYNCIIKH